MSEVKLVEVDIDNNCEETVVDNNTGHIAKAVNNMEELLHNLKLAYDIAPSNRLSSVIVAQELSLRELKALLPK